jgi:uncharacterized membrane protein
MVAVVGRLTHRKIGHLSNRKIVQVADALERTLGVYWIAGGVSKAGGEENRLCIRE